jgi:hypothetical protein
MGIKVGMTIEEATLYMELYKRNLLDSVSDLDKDIEAYKIAIDAMYKYQKIVQIIKDHDTDNMPDDYWYIDEIREVIENGNENNNNAPNAQ